MKIGNLVRSKHYGLGIVTKIDDIKGLCYTRFHGSARCFSAWFFFENLEIVSEDEDR